MDPEKLEALERIAELRKQGLLSETEFQELKERLLHQDKEAVEEPSQNLSDASKQISGSFPQKKTENISSPPGNTEENKKSVKRRLIFFIPIIIVAAIVAVFVLRNDSKLSNEGRQLADALTSQSFGGFAEGIHAISPGSWAELKYELLIDLYNHYFASNYVSPKTMISETKNSFLYSNSNRYFEVSITEQNSSGIRDFDLLVGDEKNREKVVFGKAEDMRVVSGGAPSCISTIDPPPPRDAREPSCFSFEIKGFTNNWRGNGDTCFIAELYTEYESNTWDTYFNSEDIEIRTTDGLVIESRFMPTSSARDIAEGWSTKEICFSYPWESIASIELSNGWFKGNGYIGVNGGYRLTTFRDFSLPFNMEHISY